MSGAVSLSRLSSFILEEGKGKAAFVTLSSLSSSQTLMASYDAVAVSLLFIFVIPSILIWTTW